LNDNLLAREIKVSKYVKSFKDNAENIEFFIPSEGSVFWRFNLFVENRNRLLKNLLKRKYKVSSWQPSVDFFCGLRSDRKVNTPISDWVGEHILNLWVNHEIDDLYLQKITQEIIKFDQDLYHE